MAVTLAQFQRVLVARCGVKMAYAGLDSVTVDDPNPSLSDPIREGLASVGLGVADISAVADADLAALQPADIPQAVDVAELRALESVLGNKAQPDQKALSSYLFHGRFYLDLEKTVARVRNQVERQYGIGVPAITPGVIDLGFAETIDAATGIPD